MFAPLPPKEPVSDPLLAAAREAKEWAVAWWLFTFGMSYLAVTGAFAYCRFEVLRLFKGEDALFSWPGHWLVALVLGAPAGAAILTSVAVFRLRGWRVGFVTGVGLAFVVFALHTTYDRWPGALFTQWVVPWIVVFVVALTLRPSPPAETTGNAPTPEIDPEPRMRE
jgi:hypothetical protein